MAPEEIIEGNKLIAEFDGGVLQADAVGHLKRNIFFRDMKIGLHLYNAEMLSYHSSWDWLMPVVEKIQNIDIKAAPNYEGYRIEIVVQGYVKISGFPMPAIFANVSKEGSLIAAIYKAIVEFIKWYNQTKK